MFNNVQILQLSLMLDGMIVLLQYIDNIGDHIMTNIQVTNVVNVL